MNVRRIILLGLFTGDIRTLALIADATIRLHCAVLVAAYVVTTIPSKTGTLPISDLVGVQVLHLVNE